MRLGRVIPGFINSNSSIASWFSTQLKRLSTWNSCTKKQLVKSSRNQPKSKGFLYSIWSWWANDDSHEKVSGFNLLPTSVACCVRNSWIYNCSKWKLFKTSLENEPKILNCSKLLNYFEIPKYTIFTITSKITWFLWFCNVCCQKFLFIYEQQKKIIFYFNSTNNKNT